MAQDLSSVGRKVKVIGAEHKKRWVHGLHNAVFMVWLPVGQSLQTLAMVLAHMVMVTQGQCK